MASPWSKLAPASKLGGKRASIFPSREPTISAGAPRKTPTASATSTPSSAAHGPQFEYGKDRSGLATPSPARLASMASAVSQVSRSTKTRLTILRRLLLLVATLVIVAIVLAQFTSLGRLAAGIFASTALLGLIVGFAAQNTISNMIAGMLIAVSQPIRIGDRVGFEEREGRVTDITLSYTYVDPGDGSRIVIPNQLLVAGIVHNYSGTDSKG